MVWVNHNITTSASLHAFTYSLRLFACFVDKHIHILLLCIWVRYEVTRGCVSERW